MNATELRALLAVAQVSQRGLAVLIEVNERTVRAYCLGQMPIRRVTEYAINWALKLETEARQANAGRVTPLASAPGQGPPPGSWQ